MVSEPARTHAVTGPEAAAWAERLRAANINPRTGLATDYLNHFNEAVMLLEMVPDMPECAEDFLTARDLAIEAYEKAAPNVRAQFDLITDTMTSILTAVGSAMREVEKDATRVKLAEQATLWVKPLIAACGGIINGGAEADVDTIMSN
jgi:hypothetical protein